MANDLLSIGEVAQRLGLHVKTVRNFVRNGRLSAVRIGKSYRIKRADLDMLIGSSDLPSDRQRHMETSSIIDVTAIDQPSVIRLCNALNAAANSHTGDEGTLGLHTIYNEERAHLKIVLTGSPRNVSSLLQFVATLLDQP
jgi:excisionase family DNA binding protein